MRIFPHIQRPCSQIGSCSGRSVAALAATPNRAGKAESGSVRADAAALRVHSAWPDLLAWRRARRPLPAARRSIMLDVTKRPEHSPVRYRAARPADGRGRDRHPARDLEAQRAVPARRPSRVLLRIHGRHGLEPLPAGFRLSKGEPQKAGFFGHRMESFQNEVKPFWVSEINTKSSGSVDVMEKAVDYVRKLDAEAEAHRRRARFHSGGFDGRRCARRSGQRDQGRAVRAGAPARAQDAGRTGEAANRLRRGHRFDGGGDQEPRSRRDQGRD